MIKHIFISYARIDGEEIAHNVYNAIKDDFHIWLDTYNIPEGSDWNIEIDKGIRNAKGIIIILTPAAVLSIQVKSEWNDALNRNLPIIPLLAIDCDIPRVLKVFNYVDIRSDFSQKIQLLRQKLEKLEVDHAEYLRTTLEAFKVAQELSDYPGRFQQKIDELSTVLSNWENRFEIQKDRVATGMEQDVLDRTNEIDRKRFLKRQRVIGQRPNTVISFFKNRQAEQKEIGRLLSQDTTRLVSIVGRGGMGKTALASKVLNDIELNQWPHTDTDITVDGILYLSTTTNGISLERLYLDCAKMLGGQKEDYLVQNWLDIDKTIEEKVTILLNELNQGLYIILLDNIEDVLDYEGNIIDSEIQTFIEKSLLFPHSARLFITSRLPIVLRQDTMRFDYQIPLSDGLPIDDGVALLREYDPNGMYGLRDAPEILLKKAVHFVRGVPRALEVMVGILANDPFVDLEQLLEKFFNHEDVVSSIIEENYQRLDNDARRVMEGIAVYKRPISMYAIDFLLEPFEPGLDVLTILKRLINTRIVTVDRKNKTVALHPIDIDYAYNALPEQQSENEEGYTRQNLERRASEYYKTHRIPSSDWNTLDDIEPIIYEFNHLIRAMDYDAAARTLDIIDLHYLLLWGYVSRLQNMRDKLSGKIKDEALLMKHFNSLGFIYADIGSETALDYFEKALDIAYKLDDMAMNCHILNNLSLHCRRISMFDKARDYAQKAIEVASKIPNDREIGIGYENLGSVYRRMGNLFSAIEPNQKALEIHQRLNNGQGITDAHLSLGLTYYNLGDMDTALNHLEQALEHSRSARFKRGEEYALECLGALYFSMSNVEKAMEAIQESLSIARETGDQYGIGGNLVNLARVYWKANKLELALQYAKEAFEAYNAITFSKAEAADAYVKAIEFTKQGDYLTTCNHFLTCVRVWIRAGHYRKAFEMLQEVSQIAKDSNFVDILKECKKLDSEINSVLSNSNNM